MKTTFRTDIYLATLYQLAVALVLLWLSRVLFVVYNPETLAGGGIGGYLRLAAHGLRFDLSALAYFNALFILMRILPWGFVYDRRYLRVTAWVYGICNSLMLLINLADVVYYRFTGARLRWSNIANVTADGGTGDALALMGRYAVQYWWIALAVAAAVALLMWAYRRARPVKPASLPRPWVRGVLVVVFVGCTFLAMRGRAGSGIPLAIPDAATCVERAPQVNVVLNSPFTILRSLNRSKANTEPELTFFSDSELASLRSSLHLPAAADSLQRRNVVVIIIESGGSEWIEPLMPFLDSLRHESLSIENTLACSRSSCGGATAVLAGFPAFDPFYFMLSPYNKDTFDSPATLLARRGWTGAFFYGCNHGSFNIEQTAYAAGLRRTYSREDYPDGSDYDGTWGIFDRPMARFVVDELSRLPEPFFASWFTISAHGPWTLPGGYDTSGFIHPERGPERGLEYTDVALRDFFTLASREPWYLSTTFVITADHGNRDFRGTRQDTPYLRSLIPFIVYTPDGSVAPRMVTDRVVSQHDIAPTLLGLLGWPEPYVSVGTDALDDTAHHMGIHRHDGRYMLVDTRYIILTSADMRSVEEVYDAVADPGMESTLAEYDHEAADSLLRHGQAFMQDYTHRMIRDRLSATSR